MTLYAWLIVAASIGVPLTPALAQKQITILYDAFGPPSTLKMDWGFAALIQYGGRQILFDTGNNAKIFEHNVKELGVDLKRLDISDTTEILPGSLLDETLKIERVAPGTAQANSASKS